MKMGLGILLVIAGFAVGASEIIPLNLNTTVTTTAGRVYADVQLDRATLDGIVYSAADGSQGIIRYDVLAPETLADLGIPAERIQIAADRKAANAAARAEFARQTSAASQIDRQKQVEAQKSVANEKKANVKSKVSGQDSQPEEPMPKITLPPGYYTSSIGPVMRTVISRKSGRGYGHM